MFAINPSYAAKNGLQEEPRLKLLVIVRSMSTHSQDSLLSQSHSRPYPTQLYEHKMLGSGGGVVGLNNLAMGKQGGVEISLVALCH